MTDYTCTICNVFVTDRSFNLQRHIKKCGGKKEVEDLKCNVCGKSYSSKSVLNRHLKDSHKIKKTSKKIASEVGIFKVHWNSINV